MNQDIVVCQEVYGSSNVKKKYILERSGSVKSVDLSPKFTSVSHFFRVCVCSNYNKKGGGNFFLKLCKMTVEYKTSAGGFFYQIEYLFAST